MNPRIDHESVSSIHSGNPQVRVFFLLASLIGLISALFLFLDGLSFLGPSMVHAQGDAGTEGNCIGQATELEAIPRSPGAMLDTS